MHRTIWRAGGEDLFCYNKLLNSISTTVNKSRLVAHAKEITTTEHSRPYSLTVETDRVWRQRAPHGEHPPPTHGKPPTPPASSAPPTMGGGVGHSGRGGSLGGRCSSWGARSVLGEEAVAKLDPFLHPYVPFVRAPGKERGKGQG